MAALSDIDSTATPRSAKARPARGPAVGRRMAKQRIVRKVRHGDWLVQQVRSHIGSDDETVATLAELGLCKIGRCGLFDGASSSAWGQVVHVQHLVAIRALTLHPSEEGRAYEEAARMIEAVPYTVDDRPAVHYRLDGDSFVSAESYGPNCSLNWSTALPLETVLGQLPEDVLGEVTGAIVYDRTRRRQRRMSVAEREGLLRGDAQLHPFVRLELPTSVLVWQTPEYPAHVDEDVAAGRIGLLLSDLGAEWIPGFMRSTATPLVAGIADDVLRDARGVLGGDEPQLRGGTE